MAMFKDPITKRLMRVPDRYDQDDFIVNNSLTQSKKFQDLPPTDLYTRNAYNRNEWNTKIDEYRDVTVLPKKAGILLSEKHRRVGGTRSHNY